MVAFETFILNDSSLNALMSQSQQSPFFILLCEPSGLWSCRLQCTTDLAELSTWVAWFMCLYVYNEVPFDAGL